MGVLLLSVIRSMNIIRDSTFCSFHGRDLRD